MTRFIYKYLSAYFAVKFGKILPQNRNTPYYYEVDDLIEDLSTVFGLTKKQLKYYIKGWARKQDRNFDFKEWWSPTPEPEIEPENGFEGIAFPIVRQVFSRTIANDLVAVQPMEPPRGLLFYLDYQYEGNVQRVDEPNQNGRVYPRERLGNAVEEFRPRRNMRDRYSQVTENIEQPNRTERMQGELDHPQNNATDRMLDNWRNLMLNQINNERINELYRNQLAHIQRPL